MISRTLPLISVAALACGSLSCKTKVSEPTGFLEDSSQLQRDTSVGRPDYEYRSEKDLPVAAGTAVYVAPVAVSLKESDKVDAATGARLASTFTRALKAEAAKKFKVVSSREASQLEVRTAVTQVTPAVPAINMATAIYPSSRIGSELKQAVVGEQAFTGGASTEIEVRRTSNGRRIYAMMDSTTGRKAVTTSGSKWAPVEKLCERWAKNVGAIMRGDEAEPDDDDDAPRTTGARRKR